MAYSLFALSLLFAPDSGVPNAGSNFLPFHTIRLQIAHGFTRQLIGNTLLLAPVGFTFRLWGTSLRWCFVALLGIGVAIEVAQELVERVTDIDDVLLNVIGGFGGSLLGAGAVRLHGLLRVSGNRS